MLFDNIFWTSTPLNPNRNGNLELLQQLSELKDGASDQFGHAKKVGSQAWEKTRFSLTGFYGFFMGDYGVFTGFGWVTKNLVFVGLRCSYGFWTMFHGVPTGFLRGFTVFLRRLYGFLLFPHLKSVNF